MAQKKISQEEFDEMVKENMDALGLEPEEALESTLEELKLEKVDLSAVLKRIPGSEVEDYSIGEATKALREGDNFSENLKVLEEALEKKEIVDNVVAIVLKEETVPVLADVLAKNITEKEIKLTAQILCQLLSSFGAIRDRFLSAKLPEKTINLVQDSLSVPLAHSPEWTTSLMEVIVASTKKCEPAKCKYMDDLFTDKIHEYSKSISEPRSIIVTFMHSRLLAQKKIHLTILHFLTEETSKPEGGRQSEIIVAALNTIRCLAANDEICKELCDEGAISPFMIIFKSQSTSPLLIKTACNALLQLSCSDAVKIQIMKLEGASVLASLLAANASNGDIFESLMSLMTNITLRQPQFARAFCDEMVHDSIYTGLHTFKNNPKVLRKICGCIRNLVVRDQSVRSTFINLGVEPLIRKCKSDFHSECKSEASAALRDLGFDDY